MRTELVECALTNALNARKPAKKLIHHSDRGSQYASDSYLPASLDPGGLEQTGLVDSTIVFITSDQPPATNG